MVFLLCALTRVFMLGIHKSLAAVIFILFCLLITQDMFPVTSCMLIKWIVPSMMFIFISQLFFHLQRERYFPESRWIAVFLFHCLWSYLLCIMKVWLSVLVHNIFSGQNSMLQKLHQQLVISMHFKSFIGRLIILL